ncbi:MAG: type II toxin-antitoxin system RelE/ParE family toxin [Alphaproteobacteria bacterium]|nr:type II toxin-antitoxin system RelE/ParE family toxin [Alphaproteobacteria bacterium]
MLNVPLFCPLISAQARRYRDGLERCFRMLAEHPRRGRSAARLAPSLRRWDYEAHAIFYRPVAAGVLSVRALHQRMDFSRHPLANN